jgi:hypothetical protein
MLADLLEPAVQVADVGTGIQHPFSLNLQQNSQRGVRGGMLRTEVQRPAVFLVD